MATQEMLAALAACYEEDRRTHPGYYVGCATSEAMAANYAESFAAGALEFSPIARKACRRIGIASRPAAFLAAIA